MGVGFLMEHPRGVKCMWMGYNSIRGSSLGGFQMFLEMVLEVLNVCEFRSELGSC